MQGSLFAPDVVPPVAAEAAPEVAHLFDGPVLHTGPVERIGKHDWIVVIYHHDRWEKASLYYAWRAAEGGEWRHGRDWPRYDGDRSDDGLPLSLRVLWMREAEARARLLDDRT